MRFPSDERALESALDKLQIALLRSGGPARHRVLSLEEQAVQDFGRALFAALWSEDVRGHPSWSLVPPVRAEWYAPGAITILTPRQHHP